VEVEMKLDVKVPPSPCLACGEINNMAMATFGERPPKPGDYTVCLKCGHLMVFADDLSMRNPTGAEMVEVAGRMDLIIIQKAREKIYGKKT
jgi:hypothetical protein